MSFQYFSTEDSPPPPAGTGLSAPLRTTPHRYGVSDAVPSFENDIWTDRNWQGFPIHDGGAFPASDTVPAKRTYDDEDVDDVFLANKRHQTLRMPSNRPLIGRC